MSIELAALKGAAVLAIAVVAVVVLRSSAASTRRLLLASAIVGALALPLLSAVVPSWGLWRPERVAAIESVAEVALASPVPLPAAVAERLAPGAGEHGRAASTRAAAPARPAPRATVSWGVALTALWLVVALSLLGRLGVGVAWTLRLGRSTGGEVPKAWTDELVAVSALLGMTGRDVGLRMGDAVSVPSVVGIASPTIHLPLEARSWGRARRRIVLLHELAHVKHHDNLLNLLGQVLCAVHWFDPLAWWVVRRCGIESERAVDDEVLGAGTRATDYATALVHIARGGHVVAPVASSMGRPVGLRARVAWLLDSRRRRTGWSAGRRGAFVALGAAALAALAGAGAVDEERLPRAAAGRTSTSASALALAVAERYDVTASGVELTIDQPLQGVVDDEVRSLAERYQARSVSVVAIDPCNGHVLALGAWGAGGAASAARAIEPGPTLGPITVAAALEEGMSADARYFCGNGAWRVGGRVLRDARPAGWLDARGVVARSSAIGAGRIFQDELGWVGLRAWLSRFGLDGRSEIDLPGAEPSRSLPAEQGSDLEGVLAANGVGVRANAVQLAAAYATLAAGGLYAAPTIARRVTDGGGRVVWEHSPEPRRVVSEPTARVVVEALANAVETDDGVARNARVEGLDIAGTAGTVRVLNDRDDPSDDEYAAAFVGIVHPGDSHMVLLVSVEGLGSAGGDGGGGETLSGGEVAAPAFARIVSRARAVSEHIE